MADEKQFTPSSEDSLKTLPNEFLNDLSKEFDKDTLDLMRSDLRKYEEELLAKYQRK